MSIKLAPLPYDLDALEPHVSAETLRFHHGKHHKGYVDKLNAAIDGSDYAELSPEAIIARSYAEKNTGVFNNAAQAWNHEFLWQSMSPSGGGEPAGDLRDAMLESFDDVENFRKQFKAAALAQFGSGWTWLVLKSGKLEIVSTGNADTPVVGTATPLLTLDVWEHAYYLDYQNERARYVDAFLEDLINWDFAARNLVAERAAA